MAQTSSGDRGIFYGWFVVAAGFFALFVSTGARNGFGVFIIPMSEDFDWNRSTISLAIALGWLMNGLSQPFIGRLYDRYGGRKVISFSLLLLGASTMALSLTNSIWFLILIYGLVMSAASGGTSLVTIHAVLTRWFYRKRGVVLSLSTSGASAGSLVLAPFATYLIIMSGWRVSWAVLGAFVLFLAFPLALIMIREKPEDIGEHPDGIDESAASFPASSRRPVGGGPLEVEHWADSYRSVPMWQLTGSYFVCGATTAIISAHYVPFAIERGTSPGVAAMAFGVMSGLNIVGVLAAGMISDRIGRKNTLGTVYAIRCLAYATLLFVPGMFGIWTFALIAGFSWIASAPMTSSLTAEIYGLKNMGTLNGMVTLSHQIGGALSIFMGGVLYDVFDSYTVPFAISGSLLVGASAAAYLIKERKYSSRFRAAQARPAPGVAGDAS